MPRSNQKTIVKAIIAVIATMLLISGLQLSMSAASAADSQGGVTVTKKQDEAKLGFTVSSKKRVELLFTQPASDYTLEDLVSHKGTKTYWLVPRLKNGTSKDWQVRALKDGTGEVKFDKIYTFRNYAAMKKSCDLKSPTIVVTATKANGGFIKASNGKKTIYRTLTLVTNEIKNEWVYGGITLPKGYKAKGMAAGKATGFTSVVCLK